MHSEKWVLNSNFLLQTVPQYHPLSLDYKEFWKEQKRRCIEGYWVSGKWMPGRLYFYVNFATILINLKNSKTKTAGRPLLRDLEWSFFLNFEIARGFSGFSEDKERSCNDLLLGNYSTEDLALISPNLLREDGTPKKYVDPQEYLHEIHNNNLGYPLYENMAHNFMMLGPRGFGKSYTVGAGLFTHEFIFDGATPELLRNRDADRPKPKSVIIAGAGDAKYTKDLLSKTKFCLERLPGSVELNNTYYPAPFSKQYKGSWEPGSQVTAAYKKKVGSAWITAGSQSEIKNRTFKDNPYAAQGTRANIIAFEEIGMFSNLKESYYACVDSLQDGASKFGSAVFFGTGGDMDKGTIDASYMFYHPKEFDLVTFQDVWENKGEIAYFVSATHGPNQFKDSEGRTNVEKSKQYFLDERKRLGGDKGGSSTLDNFIVYHPLVPSEIFLVSAGAILPVIEIRQQDSKLMEHKTDVLLEKFVELYWDKDTPTGVNYKIDTNNKLKPIKEFPYKGDDKEGALVIYELPQVDPDDGRIPKGLYIIGHDPVRTDSPTGPSLATIYVMKTDKYPFHYGKSEIVAQYIGRPYRGRVVVNELLHKLSKFYGDAKIYFENDVSNVTEYFEKQKALHLLAPTPGLDSNKPSFTVNNRTVSYGYSMNSRQFKLQALFYLREWLLTSRGKNYLGNEVRNLDFIYDRALLQEMLYFDMDHGNFDRVMGFLGCIIGLIDTHNQYNTAVENLLKSRDDSFDFLNRNSALFKSNNTAKTLAELILKI